jgi:small multidrug resistance pump
LGYLYLAVAIIGEVVGTSALKGSDGLTKVVPSAIVLVGYAVALYFLSLALRTLPLWLAYALWACTGTILIAFTGRVLFEQVIDAAGIIGIALMLAGVMIINFSAGTH